MSQPWWSDPAATTPLPQSQPQQQPWAPPPQQTSQQPSPWMPPPTQQPGQQPGRPPTAQVPAGQPTAILDQSTQGAHQAQGGMTIPQPSPQAQRPNVPGLGFVTFLLVVATLAFAGFILRDWVVQWGTGIEACIETGGGWDCLSNDTTRTQVLLPLVAIFAAFCLARGAGVERLQGRGLGWLYVLLGFAALGAAWVIGSPA